MLPRLISWHLRTTAHRRRLRSSQSMYIQEKKQSKDFMPKEMYVKPREAILQGVTADWTTVCL